MINKNIVFLDATFVPYAAAFMFEWAEDNLPCGGLESYFILFYAIQRYSNSCNPPTFLLYYIDYTAAEYEYNIHFSHKTDKLNDRLEASEDLRVTSGLWLAAVNKNFPETDN